MNSVNLIGNVGKIIFDNQKETQHRFVSVSLATSEKWLDSAKNEVVKTEWHKLTFFGKMAERIAKEVVIGSRLFVNGTIRYQEFETKEGVKAYSTDILVKEFIVTR
jgi:single-strand DNA-binding protein